MNFPPPAKRLGPSIFFSHPSLPLYPKSCTRMYFRKYQQQILSSRFMQVEQHFYLLYQKTESCIFVGWVVRLSDYTQVVFQRSQNERHHIFGTPSMHHSVILVRLFFCPVVAREGMFDSGWRIYPLVSCPSFCPSVFFFFFFFLSSRSFTFESISRCA